MKKIVVLSLAVVLITSTAAMVHAQQRNSISIVGSSTVYPFATVVAEKFGKAGSFKTPKIESTGTGGGFKLFCSGVGVQHPDMSNASRAIKASEFETCQKNGVTDIVEVKIGFDGIVIANSKKAAALKLTTKDIFLALAMIGPSGCGKSTFIRCLNRMNDTIEDCRVTGDILLDGVNIHDKNVDVVPLRAQVGMVFQKPNPFPKSIFENVAYGPRIHGLCSSKSELDEIVETSLKKAGLWEEVKDRMDQPGTGLSGGQQQRLCIARTIAVNPEIILMDEPCSALDPIATSVIEDLIFELRTQFSICIVTHSMQQAARVSQRTAYFHLGDLIEVGPTERIFTNPRHELTQDYITGRFG